MRSLSGKGLRYDPHEHCQVRNRDTYDPHDALGHLSPICVSCFKTNVLNIKTAPTARRGRCGFEPGILLRQLSVALAFLMSYHIANEPSHVEHL